MDTPLPAPDVLVGRLASRDRRTVADTKAALVLGGEAALEAVERATAAEDPLLRARARQLLAEWLQRRGLARLDALLAGGSVDLFDGLFAIDEVLGYRRRDAVLEMLDGWAAEVRRDAGGDPGGAAAALRRVLGGRAGLRGAAADFHHADHVSVSHTALARQGLPLTLCALYAGVARRAGVEAGLLPFPGHVLLGVGPPGARVVLDPFAGGTRVPEEACVARLMALGAPPSPIWLEPASDRSMLLRQARNLAAALERHGRRGPSRAVMEIVERHA